MTLLDRLLGHDAWTTAELLRRSRTLTDAQLERTFGIGPGGVRTSASRWSRSRAAAPVRYPLS